MNSVLLSTLIKYKEIFSEFTGREHLLTAAHPLIIQPSQLFSNARGSHFPLFYNLFYDPWWCKFGGFSIDSPVLFYNMSSVSLFPCPSLMMWNQRKRMCFSIVKCKRDPMNQGQFNMTELQLRCRSFSWWNSCWVHAAWPPFVSVEPRGKSSSLSTATAHALRNVFLPTGELSCVSESVFQALSETFTCFLAFIGHNHISASSFHAQTQSNTQHCGTHCL